MRIALLGLALVGWGFAGILAPPVYAQQRPPAQATQHALDELANCIAQGKCTLTPTPIPTVAPTATPTVVPRATEVPATDIPATPTPMPGLPVADDPDNAYLRPAPDPWLELALPNGRWLIQSECSFAPWTPVSYWTDETTHYAYLNNCVLLGWQWSSDAPCAMGDDGTCDLDLDLSYDDYLGNLPTPTPLPEAPTLVPIPTATPRPVQAAAPAPRPAPPPPAPPPTAKPPTAEAVLVRVLAPTTTASAVPATPVQTATALATVAQPTDTAIPTPTPEATLTTDSTLPHFQFGSGAGPIVAGFSAILAAGGYVLWKLR